jgi:hypothetical protein
VGFVGVLWVCLWVGCALLGCFFVFFVFVGAPCDLGFLFGCT